MVLERAQSLPSSSRRQRAYSWDSKPNDEVRTRQMTAPGPFRVDSEGMSHPVDQPTVVPFVFQPPQPLDDQEFEEELLLEVRRLGDWLRGELQDLQGQYAAPIVEPLRLVVASNESKALKAIESYPDVINKEALISEVKAAFVEQDLLLAAWGLDTAAMRSGSPRKFSEAGDFDDKGGEYVWKVLMLAGIFLALVHVAHTIPDCSIRCFLLIVSLLTLQLSGVVPQYCIGLLVPVFSTALRVLPGQTITETANLCFGAMMNQMTALVIGSFTINAVFLKCQLELRFIDTISKNFGSFPRLFLLMLMLGCMLASAVTFVTLLALSALQPLAHKNRDSGGKGLLLGIGISCTLGGALTPLSGTTSLIVFSTLTEFGLPVDFLKWVLVALPTCTLIAIVTWLILLLVFGTPPALERDEQCHLSKLRPAHWFFLGCSLFFILGCTAENKLTPWIGSTGNLGLMLTALSFGSGFLSKADFAAMPFEVLMILFGVNVTAYTLKESGLALKLAQMLIPVQVYNVTLWMEIAKITGSSLLLGTITGQTVFATLAIPVVVALGAKLYCPLLTALLTTLAVHCGVCLPHSSTDLILTLEMAGEDKGHNGRLLKRTDFLGVGLLVGMVGWLLVMSCGYFGSIALLGTPPQPIIIREPTALIPTIKWLGNETSAKEKVEILKGQMEGEDVNDKEVNATLSKVVTEDRLRSAGKAEIVQNITMGANITTGVVARNRMAGEAHAHHRARFGRTGPPVDFRPAGARRRRRVRESRPEDEEPRRERQAREEPREERSRAEDEEAPRERSRSEDEAPRERSRSEEDAPQDAPRERQTSEEEAAPRERKEQSTDPEDKPSRSEEASEEDSVQLSKGKGDDTSHFTIWVSPSGQHRHHRHKKMLRQRAITHTVV